MAYFGPVSCHDFVLSAAHQILSSACSVLFSWQTCHWLRTEVVTYRHLRECRSHRNLSDPGTTRCCCRGSRNCCPCRNNRSQIHHLVIKISNNKFLHEQSPVLLPLNKVTRPKQQTSKVLTV